MSKKIIPGRIKLSDFLDMINAANPDKETYIMFGTVDGNSGENYDIFLDHEEPLVSGEAEVGYPNTIYLSFEIPDRFVRDRFSSELVPMTEELHGAVNGVLNKYGLLF